MSPVWALIHKESYVGSIVATSALAVAAGLAPRRHGPDDRGGGRCSWPRSSVPVCLFPKKKFEQKVLFRALRDLYQRCDCRGRFYPLIGMILGWEHIGVFGAVLAGLLAGVIIGA